MALLFNVTPTPEKTDEIKSLLIGYWQNDVWHVEDSFFDSMRPTKWIGVNKNIDFSILPVTLKDEMKFFFAKRLIEQTIRLKTVIIYGGCIMRLTEFLNRSYPVATSFVDMSLENAMTKWRSYLVNSGMKVGNSVRLASANYEVLLQQLITFFQTYYDTRDEFEKDMWDVRNIPGVRFSKNQSSYFLNFTEIPSAFKPLTKRYMKVRIGTRSLSQCSRDLRSLRLFLRYMTELHPEWTNIQLLSRQDMESYLIWYRQYTSKWTSEYFSYLVSLRTFIEYIQRADYPEAPIISSAVLIWKEDLPKASRDADEEIKFIPESVLQQLEDNLEYLKPEYIPAVILLRASGWRISDIFNVRYNNCLDRSAQGWWLCGDIVKTNVLNHRVPITDDVALVVKTLVDSVEANSTTSNNPKKYLFVRLDGKRKGLPPKSATVQNALNRLAKQYNIVDDQGDIYHFGNHAFRHTKGVELINNGMNILHVQKWMAHASPEMSLRYAKVLDTTMRKSWEEAMKKGAFRLDADSRPIKVDISSIQNEDIIEWEYIRHNLDAVRMPLGYCLKPKKLECKHQLNPCLSCRNLCTTPDFIPQYEMEVREVKALIERGKAQSQSLWVEKNQHLLERYEAILDVLHEGKAHHLAGKI